MAFKVVEAKGSNSETYSEIDLTSDLDLPTSVKNEIKAEVGKYLIDEILTYVSEKKSPVSGASYKSTLSRDYAKEKKKEVGNTEANLELSGALLDSVTFKKTEDGIQLGVFGKEAGKADGHNNLSGESRLPERRFLPKEGEEFKANIQKEIDSIIADKVAESASFSKSDFEGVDTKAELYSVLSEQFAGMSRSEIRSAVLGNEELLGLITELDLAEYL